MAKRLNKKYAQRRGKVAGMSYEAAPPRFLFIWMTFVAGVVAARRGQHIGVELIVNMLPAAGKKAVGVFAHLVSTAFFGIISFYCISLWSKLSVQISPALQLPMSYVYLGIIIGSIFMGLYYHHHVRHQYAACHHRLNHV